MRETRPTSAQPTAHKWANRTKRPKNFTSYLILVLDLLSSSSLLSSTSLSELIKSHPYFLYSIDQITVYLRYSAQVKTQSLISYKKQFSSLFIFSVPYLTSRPIVSDIEFGTKLVVVDVGGMRLCL
jgi:hypothetical protein